MRNLSSSIFFILGYVDAVVEAKADPTASIFQLVLFTVVFFFVWDLVEFLEE